MAPFRIHGIPEGLRLEWHIDEDWAAVEGTNLGSRPCRWMMPNRRACGKPSVAALKRRHRSIYDHFGWRWWHYCGDHLYGRTLHDGAVWSTRVVQD